MKRNLLLFSLFCIIFSYAPIFAVNHSNVYCVILAGGVGERLWPLSRQHKPKQLLEIQEGQTLLDQAIERVALLVPSRNILVSTTKQHERSIDKLVGSRIGGIIVEPGLRNTGPAILLCCLEIYEKDPEAVIVFLPADPFIPSLDNSKFNHALEKAVEFVSKKNQITLLGVKPTYPATGYGYIEIDKKKLHPPFRVKKFHEKPSHLMAQVYLESDIMLWNIGMFCAQASVFIDEYKQLAPEMYQGVADYRSGKSSFDLVKSDSIDYAIMEKSENISVIPVDFDWCDVGNVEVFLSIKKQFGALDEQDVIETASANNLVDVPKKLVALVGVHDLCIIETDEVLLIAKREEAEKVRDIVKQLKQKELFEYL